MNVDSNPPEIPNPDLEIINHLIITLAEIEEELKDETLEVVILFDNDQVLEKAKDVIKDILEGVTLEQSTEIGIKALKLIKQEALKRLKLLGIDKSQLEDVISRNLYNTDPESIKLGIIYSKYMTSEKISALKIFEN